LESIAYRTARSHVHLFKDEGDELLERHERAMDCRDCESFLQLGIDAFKWLCRADEEIRKGIFSGEVQYKEDMDSAIAALYKLWLRPCVFAEQWIRHQLQHELKIDNLAAFRECQEEVRAIVEENNDVSGDLLKLRDEAIRSHQAGNTSEWHTA
jgi:hypothetical protein